MYLNFFLDALEFFSTKRTSNFFKQQQRHSQDTALLWLSLLFLFPVIPKSLLSKLTAKFTTDTERTVHFKTNTSLRTQLSQYTTDTDRTVHLKHLCTQPSRFTIDTDIQKKHHSTYSTIKVHRWHRPNCALQIPMYSTVKVHHLHRQNCTLQILLQLTTDTDWTVHFKFCHSSPLTQTELCTSNIVTAHHWHRQNCALQILSQLTSDTDRTVRFKFCHSSPLTQTKLCTLKQTPLYLFCSLSSQFTLPQTKLLFKTKTNTSPFACNQPSQVHQCHQQ